jgi:hypothetical protein
MIDQTIESECLTGLSRILPSRRHIESLEILRTSLEKKEKKTNLEAGQ